VEAGRTVEAGRKVEAGRTKEAAEHAEQAVREAEAERTLAVAEQAAQGANGDWTELWSTSDGRKYYYHAFRKITQWEMPPGLREQRAADAERMRHSEQQKREKETPLEVRRRVRDEEEAKQRMLQSERKQKTARDKPSDEDSDESKDEKPAKREAREDAEVLRECRRILRQVEARKEAGARGFERSLAALERQRDVASIVNGMLKFSDDEAVQKAACRSLLNLTPSVEGDEYQKIRSQDGEAWAQMQREYRALASAGVLNRVRRAISVPSAEVACAGCRILKLLARDDKNQRKIGSQVANAHEYICALPEDNVAIGNRKHTHSRTHSHTGGDRGPGRGDGPPRREPWHAEAGGRDPVQPRRRCREPAQDRRAGSECT
jgi:hypothetical protein